MEAGGGGGGGDNNNCILCKIIVAKYSKCEFKCGSIS